MLALELQISRKVKQYIFQESHFNVEVSLGTRGHGVSDPRKGHSSLTPTPPCSTQVPYPLPGWLCWTDRALSLKKEGKSCRNLAHLSSIDKE